MITPDLGAQVDVAIICVNNVEETAILRCFPPVDTVHGERAYRIALVDREDGQRMRVAVVVSGEGPIEAARTMGHIISELNPSFTLLVGIAGGIPQKKGSLVFGDVALSTGGLDVTRSELDPGGSYRSKDEKPFFIHRWILDLAGAIDVDPRWKGQEMVLVPRPPLKPLVKLTNCKDAWFAAIKRNFDERANDEEPFLVSGTFSSGYPFVRDDGHAKKWQKVVSQANCPPLIANEMELIGVHTCSSTRRINHNYLAIKGISDIVGIERDRAWTPYAAATAASFALGFVRALRISTKDDPAHESSAAGGAPPKGTFKSTFDYLTDLLKDSAARCKASWQSVGLDETFSDQLLSDKSFGNASPELRQFLSENRLAVLTGEIGAGKTLVLERLLQEACAKASSDPMSTLPVYLEPSIALTHSLQGAVFEATEKSNLTGRGVEVFLDLPHSLAEAEILNLQKAARIFVNRYDKVKVRLTTLPGNSDPSFKSFALPLSSPEQARALVQLALSAHRVETHDVEHFLDSLDDSIVETIRLPLFAFALSRHIKRRLKGRLFSKIQLVEALVSPLIDDPVRSLPDELLQRLGSMTTSRNSDWLPASEFSRSELRELERSGLVLIQGSKVRFSIPILASWYAAQALVAGRKALRVLSQDGVELQRWHEALAINLSDSSFDGASQTLRDMIPSRPGFSSRVVERAISSYTWGEETIVPEAAECGRRYAVATDAWLTAFPAHSHKSLRPSLGTRPIRPVVSSGTDAVYLAFVEADDYTGSGFLVDHKFSPRSLPGDIGYSQLTAKVGSHSSWWWRFAKDQIAEALRKLIERRALHTPSLAQDLEIVWYAGKQSNELDSRARARVELYTSPRLLAWQPTRERTGPGRIAARALRLKDANNDLLDSPYPALAAGIPLTPAEMLVVTKSVYESALSIYNEIVETWLPNFAQELRCYATQPFLRIVTVRPHDRANSAGYQSIDIPKFGGANQVEVSLEPGPFEGPNGQPTEEQLEHYAQDYRRVHPDFTFHYSGGLLPIWHPAPAVRLAYRWLESELKELGWI